MNNTIDKLKSGSKRAIQLPPYRILGLMVFLVSLNTILYCTKLWSYLIMDYTKFSDYQYWRVITSLFTNETISKLIWSNILVIVLVYWTYKRTSVKLLLFNMLIRNMIINSLCFVFFIALQLQARFINERASYMVSLQMDSFMNGYFNLFLVELLHQQNKASLSKGKRITLRLLFMAFVYVYLARLEFLACVCLYWWVAQRIFFSKRDKLVEMSQKNISICSLEKIPEIDWKDNDNIKTDYTESEESDIKEKDNDIVFSDNIEVNNPPTSQF